MLDLQNTVISFFQQFTEHVFLETNVPDPTGILFPRITVSYASGDYFSNTMYTFQIWSRSSSTLEALTIAAKVEKAIPVMIGTQLTVKGNIVYEWYNPSISEWVEFDLEDFQRLATEFRQEHGADLKWREVDGKSKGALKIYRGSPFIQPRNSGETGIIMYYGNIACRSYLI